MFHATLTDRNFRDELMKTRGAATKQIAGG